MSKRKEYTPLLEYDIFYVDIKSIMEAKGISQNLLSKITDLSINTIRSYYHSNIKRVDLDVISRIVMALDCEINDVLKKK
mgnify:FL=1